MWFIGNDCEDLFDFLPKSIAGLNIAGNPMPSSFQNINRRFGKLSWLQVGSGIKSNILGLLKINGLKTVGFDAEDKEGDDEQERAFWIIDKHLKGDRNLLKAQRELMKAGLKEYARL